MPVDNEVHGHLVDETTRQCRENDFSLYSLTWIMYIYIGNMYYISGYEITILQLERGMQVSTVATLFVTVYNYFIKDFLHAPLPSHNVAPPVFWSILPMSTPISCTVHLQAGIGSLFFLKEATRGAHVEGLLS
jgi:hypothetical protein